MKNLNNPEYDELCNSTWDEPAISVKQAAYFKQVKLI